MNLFHLMKNTYTNRLYQVKNKNLPILFISGSDDQVLGSEKRWQSALSRLRKVGYQKVTGKLYEGMRHELHNDLKKEEVLTDLLAFLKE